MIHKPIFMFGFANAEDGELSPITLSRIDKAIEVQTTQPGTVILATGGFDPRFNTSPLPHREHVHRELAARGADFWPDDQDDFLSKHTVDDATMIVAFANTHGLDRYAIATSTFHLPLIYRVAGSSSIVLKNARSKCSKRPIPQTLIRSISTTKPQLSNG